MDTIKQTFIVILLSVFSFSVNAIVLEQAPLDGGDGSFSVGPSGVQIAADDFQFSSNVLLTDISWWGSYDPAAPVTESFTVRIFEDDGFGSPEINPLFETIFSGTGNNSDGLFDLFGGEVFSYDVSGLNLSLMGGEEYYLSVFNNDDQQDWYWLESGGVGPGWSRATDGDAWINDAATLNMSFRLTADVPGSAPEPATLLLMLLPLLWFSQQAISRKSPVRD